MVNSGEIDTHLPGDQTYRGSIRRPTLFASFVPSGQERRGRALHPVNYDLRKYATMGHSYVLSYQFLHFQGLTGLVAY